MAQSFSHTDFCNLNLLVHSLLVSARNSYATVLFSPILNRSVAVVFPQPPLPLYPSPFPSETLGEKFASLMESYRIIIDNLQVFEDVIEKQISENSKK